jgi:aquaporin Z
MKKYIAELIGTFFLVLTIGCTVIGHEVGAGNS